MDPREEVFVDTFIDSRRRDRYKMLLSQPKTRRKALNRLYHAPDFDPRCAHRLDLNLHLVSLFRSLGAPERAYLISARDDLDQKEMPLEEALENANLSDATIVCCIPSQLAYWMGDAFTYPTLLLKLTASQAEQYGDLDALMAASQTTKTGRIMYIEFKGKELTGPARIGRVHSSRSGQTLYYQNKSFKSLKGAGSKSNYYSVETGDHYWISGPRRDGHDSLYRTGIPVEIDEDVRVEYWRDIRQQPFRAKSSTTK